MPILDALGDRSPAVAVRAPDNALRDLVFDVFFVAAGSLIIELPPLGGVLLGDRGMFDLEPPPAPGDVHVGGPDGCRCALFWSGVNGAARYNVYGSPVSGGGFVKLNDAPIAETRWSIGLTPAPAGTRYFVVTALDTAGNESGWSNEVARF